ncbi:stalk domain-containing protein [Paenibacillus sp. LHD-117]|uniref:stalk domain-containing protein n=1 Tax=Paenibacillus sp. LHD-117 TaxID=3071412 RepID=UPI0027E0F3B1|nr:stalk domain-containing protein [Paenibacillus sp. LHD-117]MDQ6420664.1 stalk domain-containing protein [Paenibacillus sp. LHD-117]
MKKRKLSIRTMLLVLLVALAPFHAVAASSGDPAAKTVQVRTQPVQLVFDGQKLALPKGQHAFICQGRTYVPIRYLSYALLKQVGWNGEKNEVTVSEPTDSELTELKKQLQLASGSGTSGSQQTLSMKVKEATLVFAGETKELPQGQSLFIYQGSIYVPLRFLAESIGTEIDWDPATRTVSGQSEAYRAGLEGGSQETGGESEAGGNGPGAGNGGGGGGPTVKPTYEQITASAEGRLEALRSSCQSTLLGIALQYSGADEAGKKRIIADIEAEIAACSVNFDEILAQTTEALMAGGYSTAIIADYRATFEAELEAGRKIAEALK